LTQSVAFLHVDLISLKPETSGSDRADLLLAAAQLRSIDGVLLTGVIEGLRVSDADLALFFLLDGSADIEAFGTDRRYIAFLQKDLAPSLAGLTGADIVLESDFPAFRPNGVCLAIAAPPATYDWEIRHDLAAWAASVAPESSATGLALGERQRYRGIAIAFTDNREDLPSTPSRYGALMAAGPARALA
jgi:hypothetical protein